MAVVDRLMVPATRSEVLGAGYLDKVPGKGCHDRDLRAYALVYLLDGGGYYADITTPERRVGAGDMLVLFPGKRHSYYNGDQPSWTEIWLVFRGPVFAQLEEEGLLDRARPVVHPGLDPTLMADFDALHAALARGDWREESTWVARAHQLIADAMRLAMAGLPQADLAARACAALGAAVERPKPLAHVAQELGMSYEAFRKFFVRAVGTPPAQWRQLKRIEHARRLLQEGAATLAEIAERLGYCDEYFFNRQFKRVTGISPARYRRDFGRTRAGDTHAAPPAGRR